MSNSLRDENKLPNNLFGDNALKPNLSNRISPNPLVALCRNYKNQPFLGDDISGFSTKFCQDFYLAPSDVGICITRNLDVEKIVHLEDVYKTFFTPENQTTELKVDMDNYWAVSTYIINPLKLNPMKVKL